MPSDFRPGPNTSADRVAPCRRDQLTTRQPTLSSSNLRTLPKVLSSARVSRDTTKPISAARLSVGCYPPASQRDGRREGDARKGTGQDTTIDGQPAFSCILEDGQAFAAVIVKDSAQAQATLALYRERLPNNTYTSAKYGDFIVVSGIGDPPE